MTKPKKNLNIKEIERKRKFVEKHRSMFQYAIFANEIGITTNMVGKIIRGERSDHYNVIEMAYNIIKNASKTLKKMKI